MFKHLLKGKSESSRLVRRYRSGSLPIVAPAGTLRLSEVAWMACWPAVTFMFVFACLVSSWRFYNEWLTYTALSIGTVLLMLWPTLAVVVYALGIWKTIRHSVARTGAVVFWMYWPLCRFAVCVTAAILATAVGNHIWYNQFRLYIEYGRLQSYSNVDAYTVTGNRMQDSGLVVFNEKNGVDRSKASCVVNGRTYCIAPILQGGQVKVGEKQSRTGINDLFMAGIDCCTCPDEIVTDFRCGDWNAMGQLGGMRLLDEEESRMYRLAVDKWDVNYQKTSLHTIFFHWVNDPVVEWKNLWARGLQLSILSAIFAIVGSFLITVVLNGFMRLLREFQIAAPLEEPDNLPPIGFGPFDNNPDPRKSFFPDEYRDYLSQYDATRDQDPKFVIL